MADEPAFPQILEYEEFDEDSGKYRPVLLPHGGMSLRDYFAARALTLIANNGIYMPDLMAQECYEIADAMLKQRSIGAVDNVDKPEDNNDASA